jgi:hypothetical protein
MADSIDNLIAAEGRALTVIKNDAQAIQFWKMPAKAKIVLFYWTNCHWCKVFLPEFVKIAPRQFTPDLMVAAVERSNMNSFLELSGIAPDFGFPHTVLLQPTKISAKSYQVTHQFRSREAGAFALELFAAMPELTAVPSLSYLMQIARASKSGGCAGGVLAHGGAAGSVPCPGARPSPCVGFGVKPAFQRERTSSRYHQPHVAHVAHVAQLAQSSKTAGNVGPTALARPATATAAASGAASSAQLVKTGGCNQTQDASTSSCIIL